VILGSALKAAVTHDHRSFYKSEEVYKNLKVPWKRGLIFLGVGFRMLRCDERLAEGEISLQGMARRSV
jgi:hypothetical protein